MSIPVTSLASWAAILPYLRLLSFLLILMGSAVPPTLAGPNADGRLMLHVEESLSYSSSPGMGSHMCGRSEIRDCAEAVVSIEGDDERGVVIYVLAAFPTSPRLCAVTFGVDYTTPTPAGYGSCAQVEVHDADWPLPFTGTSVSWSQFDPVTDRLAEIYWFFTYAYDGTYFALMENPRHGGFFGDDAVPTNQDEIDAFGILGFGLIGENPCLEGLATGACCRPDGSCLVTTEYSCEESDGVYMGDDIVCDEFLCRGRCCINEQCFADMTKAECDQQGGEDFQVGLNCGPTSCVRTEVSWGKLKDVYRY